MAGYPESPTFAGVRFLLTRRWLLFALVVAFMAFGAVQLGEWQFSRLHDREARNEIARTNLAADPVPLEDALSTTDPVPASREWLRVRFSGTYDDGATVVLRYQTRDGESGVDLVTPLITDSGTAVLVDRGWVPTKNTGTVPDDLPPPPAGQVEVTGWVRADATGRGIDVDTSTTPGSTRALSSRSIGDLVAYPLYQGFVDAETETPSPETVPVRTELPDLGEGPHFFYGIQWWFFGALAVGGFLYLVWDERRRKQRELSPAPDEPATTP